MKNTLEKNQKLNNQINYLTDQLNLSEGTEEALQNKIEQYKKLLGDLNDREIKLQEELSKIQVLREEENRVKMLSKLVQTEEDSPPLSYISNTGNKESSKIEICLFEPLILPLLDSLKQKKQSEDAYCQTVDNPNIKIDKSENMNDPPEEIQNHETPTIPPSSISFSDIKAIQDNYSSQIQAMRNKIIEKTDHLFSVINQQNDEIMELKQFIDSNRKSNQNKKKSLIDFFRKIGTSNT